ncbi:hypothetical protein Tco_0856566 [Tanacetum coccineum]|uniref:Retrotransposon gag domain-containing protein n=1 Tax=Tanacetum coccineum TaxID=301880 RepID=A0ABQ5B7Z1_9ASTR
MHTVVQTSTPPTRPNPKTAKDAWDTFEAIFQDNKRTRVVALKGELCMIQMGDQTADEYLLNIDSIVTLLNDLGSDVSQDDVVTYAINGLSDKYGYLAQIIAHKEPFPDLSIVRSMVFTEEMRIRNKSHSLFTPPNSSQNNTRTTPPTCILELGFGIGGLDLAAPATTFILPQAQNTLLANMGYLTISIPRPLLLVLQLGVRVIGSVIHGLVKFSSDVISTGDLYPSKSSILPQAFLVGVAAKRGQPTTWSSGMTLSQQDGKSVRMITYAIATQSAQAMHYGVLIADKARLVVKWQHSNCRRSIATEVLVASWYAYYVIRVYDRLTWIPSFAAGCGDHVLIPTPICRFAGALQYLLTFTLGLTSLTRISRFVLPLCLILESSSFLCSRKRILDRLDADWLEFSVLSRSSAEAGVSGVTNAVAGLAGCGNLLHEFSTPLSTSTIVYCDNCRHAFNLTSILFLKSECGNLKLVGWSNVVTSFLGLPTPEQLQDKDLRKKELKVACTIEMYGYDDVDGGGDHSDCDLMRSDILS